MTLVLGWQRVRYSKIAQDQNTWKLKIFCLLQEKVNVLEVFWKNWSASPHEVEDVSEHPAVSRGGREHC